MNIEELYQLVNIGEQRRNVEFKSSMSWSDNNTKEKIVKGFLAMSNIRDGGYMIFGVDEQNDDFIPNGMDLNDLATFKYDNVSAEVARFADPFLKFIMEIVNDQVNNVKFLVFTIFEFEEIPVICKINGYGNIREADIFTRPRRMPSSAKVPTQTEMREILDIAVEKGIRKYLERTERSGLKVLIREEPDKYDSQIEEFQ